MNHHGVSNDNGNLSHISSAWVTLFGLNFTLFRTTDLQLQKIGEEPKENWLHNSIWKTLLLQQYYVILWIQKWRSWRKIYTCAPERFVIRERKGKKGFLKFEANGNLSHVSALIWLEFHTFTHDWVSRKKNEITQKKESKKSQVDGKKIPKANSKLFVKA